VKSPSQDGFCTGTYSFLDNCAAIEQQLSAELFQELFGPMQIPPHTHSKLELHRNESAGVPRVEGPAWLLPSLLVCQTRVTDLNFGSGESSSLDKAYWKQADPTLPHLRLQVPNIFSGFLLASTPSTMDEGAGVLPPCCKMHLL
jgi:hypothetical protein